MKKKSLGEKNEKIKRGVVKLGDIFRIGLNLGGVYYSNFNFVLPQALIFISTATDASSLLLLLLRVIVTLA